MKEASLKRGFPHRTLKEVSTHLRSWLSALSCLCCRPAHSVYISQSLRLLQGLYTDSQCILFTSSCSPVPSTPSSPAVLSSPARISSGRIFLAPCCCCCCQVASVVLDCVRPQRWQPTRLCCPWDSPGKNTGVGCHCLLQCMKVKSESEVAQSCLTLSNTMDYSPPGSSIHGIFQARVLEWGT